MPSLSFVSPLPLPHSKRTIHRNPLSHPTRFSTSQYPTRASLTTPSTPSPSTPSSPPSSYPTPEKLQSHSKIALYDVLVIGAGPAGLSLSSALGQRQLTVACADPQLHKPWPNHYGVWEDEFQKVGLADCATARYENTTIYAGQKKIVLDRPYIRVDRIKLKQRFVNRCKHARVTMIPARVTEVDHPSRQWSLVRFDDQDLTIRARVVIDCTGHALQFTNDSGKNGYQQPWAQAAYGVEAVVNGHPFETDEMLLMDFRDDHAIGDMREASDRRPTFLYVFPSGERRGFFEETSVIAPTAVSFEELKKRLERRLEHSGIVIERVIEEEFSLIPMGGSLPRRGRVVGFGGAGGLVHPATGYMVGRTVKLAEELAEKIGRGLEEIGEDGDVERVAQMGWDVTWNIGMLRQRDFLKFGAELLGTLGMRESCAFFDAFFKLPEDLWGRFLGYELDSGGMRGMFALWFFAIADNEIRIRLLRGIVEIGGWRLIRSVLPEWMSGWQGE
uniref:lycopene beta-cyclase n=1 Tax=Grateloupia turuturu TaxID=118375 RepID=A0A2H4YKG4_9FLOR|nr:lycopene epsilon-cyclase [Grateloupia turuturu]